MTNGPDDAVGEIIQIIEMLYKDVAYIIRKNFFWVGITSEKAYLSKAL